MARVVAGRTWIAVTLGLEQILEDPGLERALEWPRWLVPQDKFSLLQRARQPGGTRLGLGEIDWERGPLLLQNLCFL